MTFLLDVLVMLISLVFLAIVGIVAGVAIPGLFLAALAPWLDWILPVRKKRIGQTEEERFAQERRSRPVSP